MIISYPSNNSRLIHHIFCTEALNISEHLISLRKLISTKKYLRFSKEPNIISDGILTFDPIE